MIRETIQKEVIAAMKGGNKERTAALRLVAHAVCSSSTRSATEYTRPLPASPWQYAGASGLVPVPVSTKARSVWMSEAIATKATW